MRNAKGTSRQEKTRAAELAGLVVVLDVLNRYLNLPMAKARGF